MKNILAFVTGAAIAFTIFSGCIKTSNVPVTIPKVDTTVSILTTDTISNITATTAVCGGNISSDGGGQVTARGVCWSKSTGPTVALTTKTSDGTGTGSFTSSITGVAGLTTYYVRAYSTNSAGTAYGNELIFTTPFGVGASFGGGIVAYVLQAGDPGYSASVQHGLIVAASDQSTGIQWGCYDTLLGVTSGAFGTGRANTKAIVQRCGAGTAAKLCDDLVLGGYNDWYLPSLDELGKLNNVGNFYPDGHWTSTEFDRYSVWAGPDITNWDWNMAYKYLSFKVRAVRSF